MNHYIIFVGNQATVFGTIFIAYFNSLILSLVAYPVIRQNLFMTLLHLRWNSIVKSIQREWSRGMVLPVKFNWKVHARGVLRVPGMVPGIGFDSEI